MLTHSLTPALTPARAVSIFDLAVVPQVGAETEGATDFSALLPSFDLGPDVDEAFAGLPETATDEPILPETSAAPVEYAVVLPVVAETGNILPPVAASVSELPANPAPVLASEGKSAAAVTQQPTVPHGANLEPGSKEAVSLANGRDEAARGQGRSQAGETAVSASTTRPAKPAPGIAVAVHVAPASERAGAQDAAPAARIADINVRAAVLDSAASRGGQREFSGEGRSAPGGSAKLSIKAAVDLPRFAAPVEAVAQSTLASVVSSGDALASAAHPVMGVRSSLEVPALRDLARIVDSLASAREALSAQSATLALDHAEFGEMSLRFDQRPNGLLSVQLSAADRDAHQAIAAAVAERPIAAPGEAAGSTGQSQSHSGGATTARSGSADRDGQAPSRETDQQQRQDRHRGTTRGEEAAPRGDGRPGIYA